jgi:hypothetical protein
MPNCLANQTRLVTVGFVSQVFQGIFQGLGQPEGTHFGIGSFLHLRLLFSNFDD